MNSNASALGRVARKLRKGVDILFYGALRMSAPVFGFEPKHRAKDRRLLDEHILPALARVASLRRVLFVGCDWYTEHVEGLFVRSGREYWTIEIDPARARHGAKRHIVGPLVQIDAHFAGGSLDLIVCNGVIGWGLNDPVEIEKSMAACARALAPGGILLLGWDDIPEKLPVPIEKIEALRSLRPTVPPGFEAAVIRTGTYTNHTFGFWEKAA